MSPRVRISSIVVLLIVSWAGISLAPETSPVSRGAAVANNAYCLGCHAPKESTGPNPSDCSTQSGRQQHPIQGSVCEDVLAFFEVIRLRRNFPIRRRSTPSNSVMAGEVLARKYNCFQCHGFLGQGGFKNAGALKGYIPGYFGTDFKLLTDDADPGSVRQWIAHGTNHSLTTARITGPIARYFLQRQRVSMPSFHSLPADEIESLVNYVLYLHELGPMSASDIREYAAFTVQ